MTITSLKYHNEENRRYESEIRGEIDKKIWIMKIEICRGMVRKGKYLLGGTTAAIEDTTSLQ